MNDALQGRWRLEMGRPHADPSGNEFVFGGGHVALASTGEAMGSYEINPGRMTITLPPPVIDGEGWQMIARLPLPDPRERADRLAGIVEAIISGEPPNVVGPCVLVRLAANA